MAGVALAAVALASFAGPAAAACDPVGAENATVRAVGEDLSLALADGRVLRLAGIEPVAATPGRPDGAAAARAQLAAWLAGRDVQVRAPGSPDRWGRLAALVFAPAAPGGGGAPLAVAVAMAEAGLARARPESALPDCAGALLGAERGARAAALGLWADPYYAVRAASDGPALTTLAGEWVVVEGRVAHVGRTRTATYLDLDARRRGGLALRLGRSFTPGQAAPGQDGWIGRRVRARGVLDERNGPQLDIRDAAQIELLPEAEQPAAQGGAADVRN